MQPTALVNEAYLRLIDQTHVQCHNRAQFFGIAANLMRQILINCAKRHSRLKRGGGNRQITLADASAIIDRPVVDLLALDEALRELTRLDARQGQVVKLRFFGGLERKKWQTCWASLRSPSSGTGVWRKPFC